MAGTRRRRLCGVRDQYVLRIAKEKPDYFIAGHAGIGTSQHLGGELFMAMTGVKFQQVPYRGTTQILPDLLGGRLNLFFGNISNVLPLVREGKLRAFGITSTRSGRPYPWCGVSGCHSMVRRRCRWRSRKAP